MWENPKLSVMMLDGRMFTGPLLRCGENPKFSVMILDGYSTGYSCHALGKPEPLIGCGGNSI
jgi:hypothetical protein